MNNGIQKKIWLHICKEGGKWSVEETAQSLNLEKSRCNTAMHNMASRASMLVRSYDDRGRTVFGVTADCTVPFGMTVDEIAGALA